VALVHGSSMCRARGRNDMAIRIAHSEFDAEDVETLKGLNEIACEVVRRKEPVGKRRPA
jgi:hypothetical protein